MSTTTPNTTRKLTTRELVECAIGGAVFGGLLTLVSMLILG